MTLSLTCKHCGELLTGDVEDELVARVQTHVSDHARDHAISREQILARLARQQSKEQLPNGERRVRESPRRETGHALHGRRLAARSGLGTGLGAAAPRP